MYIWEMKDLLLHIGNAARQAARVLGEIAETVRRLRLPCSGRGGVVLNAFRVGLEPRPVGMLSTGVEPFRIVPSRRARDGLLWRYRH